MDKCPPCNVEGAWCWLGSIGRCERLADGIWSRHNRARSKKPPPGPDAPEPVFGLAPAAAADVRAGRAIELDSEPERRPTSGQVKALRTRMLACPHRQPHSCSCAQLATCTLGKGNAGTVDHHDCRDCLLAQDHDP